MTERCLSSDSIKASSGDISPYDNNSPDLSGGLLWKYTEDSSVLTDHVPEQNKLSGCSKDRSGSTSPSTFTDKG